MNRIFVIIAFVFIACGQDNNTNKGGTDTARVKTDTVPDTTAPAAVLVYTRYVPAKLLNHISTSLPGWSLPDPSSWDKYWWDQYRTNNSLVNYFSGDFNCDGTPDHAMVLTDTKNNIGAWAFLANESRFQNVKLDEFENLSGQIGCGLELLKPGKYGDLNNEDINYRVDVKCPGITVIFFEKAARSYYFENGKLKWIQSGD